MAPRSSSAPDLAPLRLSSGAGVPRAPSPTAAHAFTQARMCAALAAPSDPDLGEDGWWICANPEVALGPGARVQPDLAGWRRSNLPGLPAGPVTQRPDWVAEVLSPGSHARERVALRRLYGDHGVPFLWLVDPAERLLEGFAFDDGLWVMLGAWTDGDHLGVLPFEGLTVELSSVLPPL